MKALDTLGAERLKSLRLRVFTGFSLFVFFALFAVNTFAQAPPNDQFKNRVVLTGTNITVTGSNTNATKQPGEPDHAGNVGGASLWWAWTAPTNGDLVMNTDGSDFDTLLGVYIGSSVSTLSVVATNDDHNVFVTSRVRFEATGGTQYQIAVDGFNDGTTFETGNIVLNLAFIPEPILGPPNDNFTNRILLSAIPVVTNGSNIEATHEPGGPLHAGEMGDTSVWWSWTAVSNETVRISTRGSSFDTLLAVYIGSALTNLTMVATNDDEAPADGILTSIVFLNAIAGQTYQIAVDGFDGASGQIALAIESATATLSSPSPLPDGTFQFTLNAPLGNTYQIEGSTNLSSWTLLETVLHTNATSVVTDSDATNFPQRFYRATLKL
jgi:hypothetical protein